MSYLIDSTRWNTPHSIGKRLPTLLLSNIPSRPLFRFFQAKITIFTNQCEKVHPVNGAGFESTSFRTWVSSQNHLTRASRPYFRTYYILFVLEVYSLQLVRRNGWKILKKQGSITFTLKRRLNIKVLTRLAFELVYLHIKSSAFSQKRLKIEQKNIAKVHWKIFPKLNSLSSKVRSIHLLNFVFKVVSVRTFDRTRRRRRPNLAEWRSPSWHFFASMSLLNEAAASTRFLLLSNGPAPFVVVDGAC